MQTLASSRFRISRSTDHLYLNFSFDTFRKSIFTALSITYNFHPTNSRNTPATIPIRSAHVPIQIRIRAHQRSQIARAQDPAGKAISSQNAVKHGLFAYALVIRGESADAFQVFAESYVRRFEPRDDIELDIVRQMTAAMWRIARCWTLQTQTMNEEMDLDGYGGDTVAARTFETLSRKSPSLQLLHRFENSYHRVYNHALRTLANLRKNFPVPDSDPQKHQNEPKTNQSPDRPIAQSPIPIRYLDEMATAQQMGRRVALAGMIVSGSLAVAKIIIGLIANSTSVVADGIESASDVFASGIVLFGLFVAARPATKIIPTDTAVSKHSSGLGVGMMLATTVSPSVCAPCRKFSEIHSAPEFYAIWPLIASIVLKAALSWVKFYYGRKIRSDSLVADALNDSVDILSGFVALAALGLTLYDP